MSDEHLERRVDKLEDESKQFIKDIATIKTQVEGIKEDSSATKKIVEDIRTELIEGEKKSLVEFANISKEMGSIISAFKQDLETIGHQCYQKETIAEIQDFKSNLELKNEYKKGKKNTINKILHYLYVPVGIALYVLWDKFLAKIVYKIFGE